MEAVAPLDAEATLLSLFATSTDGETIRRRWLNVLMRHFDAPLAMSHNVGYEIGNEALSGTDVFFEGTDDWRVLEAAVHGQSLAFLHSTVEQMAPMNRFGPMKALDVSTDMAGQVWRPLQVHSALAANYLDGQRYVGFVGLYRASLDTPEFSPQELTTDTRVWERCTATLMTATHAMLASGPSQRGAMLFRIDGTPWMQNKTDQDWASEEYSELLQRHLQSFLRASDSEVEFHQRNTRINLSKLSGHGDQAILMIVEPMRTPRVTALCELTALQRRIASLVACGFTVDEIAADMSRSAGTIKTHLGKIYRRLGITGRSELASLYESAFEWRP